MELRVFDKTVQPLGAIDELASLLWHTKYFDVGTFSLLAPITDNNSRLLVEGNLITKHDGKKEVKTADGGVWRRAAQITYVHITKDENGLEQLEAQGVSVKLLDMHTIKPLDTDAVMECVNETGKIITVEDHNIMNGLGSAVSEVAAETGRCMVKRIGIRDQFGQSAPYERLLEMNGITVENIVETAKELVK